MIQGIKLSIYPVKEIGTAKTLYSKLLGVEPYADSPYYVGFRVGDHEIGLDPNEHAKGMNGPLDYWIVSDIRQALQSNLEAGAQLHQEVSDVGGGRLIAIIQDADGNLIGLMQNP